MASYFNATYYFAAKAKQLSTTEKTWTAAEVQAEFAKQGIKAEDHYKAYGASEGLSPNAYFNEKEYLASKLAALQDNDPTWANKTVADLQAEFKALGINAADHYEQYGAFETRKDGTLLNPSNAFDANAYFAAKLAQLQKINFEGADTMTVADVVKAVQEAGISPVAHLQAYGATEAKTDGIPLVQTVPVAQRVPNDPIRAQFGELVPSNYNPPSKAPAAAVAAPVTKPADVGGLSANKPVIPTAPVKVPGDTGYIAPPANLVDTNEKPVLPPTTTEGTGPNAGFIVVDPTTGKGTVIDPATGAEKGTVDVVVKDGVVTPPAPNAPVVDKDGNNINDKPADDTGKPMEPTPPTVDPDEGEGDGGTPSAPVLTVTPAADNVKNIVIKLDKATEVTITEDTAKTKYLLTPTGGVAKDLIKDFADLQIQGVNLVTLKGTGDLLSGKKVTLNGEGAKATVLLTDVKGDNTFGNLHTDLTVKATLAENVTYVTAKHGTIDEIIVPAAKTLTGAATDLTGKTVTGAGNVNVTALAANTDLSKMADSLNITANIAASIDITANSNLTEVDVFDVAASQTLTANADQVTEDAIMGSGGATINGSTGDQILNVQTLGANAIAGGKGADTISLGETGTARAITYTGTDTIKFDGAASVDAKETTAVTFRALTAGQTITVGDLTLTAKQGMDAAAVAGVFDDLAANAVTPTETAQFKCTGTLGAWTSSGIESTSKVTFTSATNGNVTNLVVSGGTAFATDVAAPTAPAVNVTTPGGTGAETATVTFKALENGATVIIAGLTLTASAAMTAKEVAAAFLAGTGVTGTITSGWSKADAVSGENDDQLVLTFTAGSDETNLEVTGSATDKATIETVDGYAARAEVTEVTFGELLAGQSVTVAGLTVKAVANLTAIEVAAAFASKAAAATGTDTNSIDFDGTLTGWGASAADGAKITFTSSASADTNIVISQAGFTAPSATDTSTWTIDTVDGTLATTGSDSQWVADGSKHDIIMSFDKSTDKLQFENVTEAVATTDGANFILTNGVITDSNNTAFNDATTANEKLIELFKNATVTADKNILAFEAAATYENGDSLYVVLCDATAGLGAGDTVLELVGVDATSLNLSTILTA